MRLIVCNTFFHELFFHKERMIRLRGENTLKFFYDIDFQQMILEKIVSPFDQLIIADNGPLYHLLNDSDDLHIPVLNGVLILSLPIDIYVKLNELYPDCIPLVQNLCLRESYQEEIGSERMIPFLQRATKFIDFDSIPNLPGELSLSPSIEVLCFEYCDEINQLCSPLPNLRVINLLESCICNLNDFKHLKELSMDDVQFSDMKDYSKDYSILNTVKKLYFRELEELEEDEFSFLQETEEVHVFTCFDIVYYSDSFRKSKRITIEDCSPSTDIDIDLSYYSQVKQFTLKGEKLYLMDGLTTGIVPPTLQHLHLENVCGIANLVGFEHLRKITLINCPSITSLRGLKGVPSIYLYGLLITSLDGLGENSDIWIEACDNIMNFSLLKHINGAKVVNCKEFIDASHLDHVAIVLLIDS